MKQEYHKNPTEQIQLRLEVKLQMLRRVEDQLRLLTSDSAVIQVNVSFNATHNARFKKYNFSQIFRHLRFSSFFKTIQ